MKKVFLFFIFVWLAASGYAVERDGTINGYFQIENSSYRHSFWASEEFLFDYTSIGFEPETSVNLFITEKQGSRVAWTITPSANRLLNYISISGDGTYVHFRTNGGNGIAQILAKDESGKMLTIDIYVNPGGLSQYKYIIE